MKISLNWINEFVEIKDYFDKVDELVSLITQAGLEVENTEDLREPFRHVVIGKVVELGKHPDADKLTLCQVDVGEGDLRQIICGAKNHKQGDKVVVAKPGAVLPGNFKIKESKIRGVESLGMMCSESELGLSEESEGILIVGDEGSIGDSFASAYGFDDIVFELSVTPNRADCLSQWGLAREIAALLGRDLKAAASDGFKVSENVKTQESLSLEVKDTARNPRYAGRLVRGVEVKESPQWLKSKLEKVGFKSINNVVDITNYILIEMGQPLHAFDLEELKGPNIIVDAAQKGEEFTTLDGTLLKLTGDELTIRDAEGPVALAGVIGGKHSGVTEKTQNIFIEAAYFTPQTVRKTSRRHGISTDSAYRFSRGVDPKNTLQALNRACLLVQQVAGGEVASDIYDIENLKESGSVISVTKDQVGQRLGYEVEEKSLKDWLERVGCQVVLQNGTLNVTPPSYRPDITIKEDLIEEYARLHGYDKVLEILPSLTEEPTSHDSVYLQTQQITRSLVQAGFHQTVNYAFLNNEDQKKFYGDFKRGEAVGLNYGEESVFIRNPLSEEYNSMRRGLLTGLFQNLIHNYRHEREAGRLFEVGSVFAQNAEQEYQEALHIGFIAWGQEHGLNQKQKAPVVYEVKGAIESLLKSLSIKSWQWKAPRGSDEWLSAFHPGQSIGLFVEGQMVGLLGSLHPLFQEEAKIRTGVALAELNFQTLMRRQPRVAQAKIFSKLPAVKRDLAFKVPMSVSSDQITQVIKKAAGNDLNRVYLFDVYQGEELGEGVSSQSYRMIFQGEDRTLGEDEVSEKVQKVREQLEKKLKLEIR